MDLFGPQFHHLNLFRLEALPDRSAPAMEPGNGLVDLPLGGAELGQERFVMFPGRVGLLDQAMIAPLFCSKQLDVMVDEKGDLTHMGPDEPIRIKLQGDQPLFNPFFDL